MASFQAQKSSVGDVISQGDFDRIRDFLYRHSGIDMSPSKKVLIASRLRKRLEHYRFKTYGEYFDHAMALGNDVEKTLMVDLLTTNETYFFREMNHFTFLSSWLREQKNPSVNAWSAACSTGEEAYSIAMVLAEAMPKGSWQVYGSDISNRVVETAKIGHYPLDRNEGLSLEFKKKYCLKGFGPHEGTFIIQPELQAKVTFNHASLLDVPKATKRYDVIFLRNVMIYFDKASKQKVVNNVLKQLRPGGIFFISHTESLFGVDHPLKMIKPSVYRMPD